jgi:YD repeat-containing protein
MLRSHPFPRDYQNRLVRKFYPDSTTVTYAFDPVGRLIQVTCSPFSAQS